MKSREKQSNCSADTTQTSAHIMRSWGADTVHGCHPGKKWLSLYTLTRHKLPPEWCGFEQGYSLRLRQILEEAVCLPHCLQLAGQHNLPSSSCLSQLCSVVFTRVAQLICILYFLTVTAQFPQIFNGRHYFRFEFVQLTNCVCFSIEDLYLLLFVVWVHYQLGTFRPFGVSQATKFS